MSVLSLATAKFLSSKNAIKSGKQNLGNIKSCFGTRGQILVVT